MSLKLSRFPFSIRWDNTHGKIGKNNHTGTEMAVGSADSEFCNIHVRTDPYRKRLEEIDQNVHIAYLQVLFFILFFSLFSMAGIYYFCNPHK